MISLYAGLTSQTLDLFIQDSTTGAGETGLVFNTSGLAICYRKGATGSFTAITLATQTVGGAWSSGGFVELDSTNAPGVYRLDIPNAAVDTAGFVTVVIKGTGVISAPVRIDCRPLPVDVKQFGGTNGTFSGGRPEVNTTNLAGQTVTAAAGVTFPTSVASPTNITAATGVVLSATTHTGAVIPTVTTLTNLPAITANWLTSAGIAAGALDGKGDWLNAEEVGEGGSGLTAIPWNAAWDAEVQSECTDALNAYDPPTKTEQDAAFTEIKGAGWSSSTDTLEKIRDASGDGGGGGTTVQINPIAIHTGAPAEAPLLTCHQGEYGDKAYLFYDIDQYGQRSATDFSGYTDLRIGVALPDGTVWIETADISVSANQLTIPIGTLTNDTGTFDATLWDWAGAGATDQRLVVACMQLVVTEAVGADEVVT